jgi:branched-chain amino acid transport system permease protein
MSVGINASKYKAIAALMSGTLAGFSGSFYALYFLFIDPYSVMSFEISAMLVIMSVVGGSGSFIGPFIGSFLYVPLSEYIRAMLGVKVVGFHMVVFGALLIIVALFFPGGIMGFLSKYLRRLR